MNPDEILDLLENSDIEFDDDDDDADPTYVLPGQHENNNLGEASESEGKEQLETTTQFIDFRKSSEHLTCGIPMEYFKKYFPEELYELAASCTNEYYMENTGKISKTSSIEIKKFFGIHVIIGCIKFPRLRMYWSAKFRYDPVSAVMSRDRFFQLRVNLHFANFVMQPLIDFVRNRCLSIDRSSTYYSIDEQMIPFLGRCQIRQFVKGKPRPVGLKNFVITTSDGLIIDFEIYQGLTTLFPDKTLGLGPAVILRLINIIPEGSSVFFDRYFTTIPLMQKLVQLKIHGTDTKMKRGDFEEVVSDDKNICLLKWKDNKSVVTTSTCYGGLPTSSVSRWDKKQNKYIDVQIPNMISKYNEKMGGVDHFDQMMEYYRTWLKKKKWPLKNILHLLDLTVTNIPKKKIKDLLQFGMEIGESLFTATPPPPTYQVSEEDEEPPKNKIHTRLYQEMIHKGCESRSKVICMKCKTYLCMSKGKTCFEDFHKPYPHDREGVVLSSPEVISRACLKMLYKSIEKTIKNKFSNLEGEHKIDAYRGRSTSTLRKRRPAGEQ
ncbi:hypothetical protein AGLY_002036 [Aphis glycines]|uniref:PiggyBac transposable element-derived protein domain-containing protein n=1 Tax=Aphis glycines TaxID=307491 RepID=A0A6G0U4D7_APHGL|nr:hypothetical protein AGLY_002036 [Aphis glycines]